MCQRLLSTPCAWNQAYRPGTSSDMWRRPVNFLRELFTTADDVSALSVDTLLSGIKRIDRERGSRALLSHTLSQEDDVGHVAPTRQSPPRAVQQLTTCQLCLSTPCNWNQAYRHNFLAGCIDNFTRGLASLIYRCGSASESTSHVPSHTSISDIVRVSIAVTDGIIRQAPRPRSSMSHNVTSLLLGSHVDWHFAVGWPAGRRRSRRRLTPTRPSPSRNPVSCGPPHRDRTNFRDTNRINIPISVHATR